MIGPNPATVAVRSGETVTLSFSVSCAPTGTGSGALTIATSTSGANLDPDGYMLTLDGMSSQAIGINDTLTVTLPAGAHPVALSGIAANCTVSGGNPRTVAVQAGGADTTIFAVSCSAASPPAEVRGEGQLKMGSPTLGNFVQTFDFDVRADLTGRFRFTDYNSIENGSPGTLVTDPAADPETSFTAYRNASSMCSDLSHGVEFDAVGRDQADQSLMSYTVELCDNGQPGSGAEFLSVYVAEKGYGRSGTLTSGDIAKQ